MHDRGVVTATKLAPDFRVGKSGQHFCQIHGDLARPGDIAGTPCREHLGYSHVVMRRDTLLDFIDGDETATGPEQV